MVGVDPDSEGLRPARRGRPRGVRRGRRLAARPGRSLPADRLRGHVGLRPRAQRAPLPRRPASGPSTSRRRRVARTSSRRSTSREHLDEPNVNMVTCGGQATIPIVHAVSRVVARRLRRDRGHGGVGARPARAPASNIDEFTRRPRPAVEVLGGAARGKAIIILNPAEPPLIMRDTIYCSLPAGRRRGEGGRLDPGHGGRGADLRARLPAAGRAAVRRALDDGTGRVATFIEVEGAGDYLPPYSGNLDIMTAAATKVGEEIARELTPPRRSTLMTVLRRSSTSGSPTPACGTAPTPSGTSSPRRTSARSSARSTTPACRSSRSPTATASAARRTTTASR